MPVDLLTSTIDAFNGRRYREAEQLAAKALQEAVGRDELFWLGLHETCHGFALIMEGQVAQAQPVLIAAMENLRNFGFRYHDVEVTSVLAGLRRGVEEARVVGEGRKRIFDVSLLPRIKRARKADGD